MNAEVRVLPLLRVVTATVPTMQWGVGTKGGSIMLLTILIVLLLTSDRTVMGDDVNSRLVELLGWATFVVMVVAALGLFITS